jgi:hypothetical protein
VTIIETIREKVREHTYEFTIPHFFEEMANDDPSLRILKWSLPADEFADASHAIPAARAMKLSAQQRTDEKLPLSAG